MKTIRLAGALSAALLTLSFLAGCAAVYPEIGTKTRKLSGDVALDPPPPEDLRWIKFLSARVPSKTRDGRSWSQAVGKLPDPYAKLLINDEEVLRTDPQSETLEPTWPGASRGNFRVTPADRLRVEVWDSNAISDAPIGVRDFRATEDVVLGDRIRLDLPGGGEVVLAFERAHAMFGLGMWFELRTDEAFVTRMLEGSPAERAGVLPGDEVVEIRGKKVKEMSSDEVRSQFGAIPMDGLPVTLRHEDGSVLRVTLKEGPIYPPFSQFGVVD
jgi:hypothetical protein